MLFYETVWGFYFRSLGRLYEIPTTVTYKYDQKNVTSEPFSEGEISVLDMEFVKTFDSLDEIRKGTFANRVISLDPLMRKKQSQILIMKNTKLVLKIKSRNYTKYLHEQIRFETKRSIFWYFKNGNRKFKSKKEIVRTK
jgi:hypothetical protein